MLFTKEKEDEDDFFPNPNYHSNLSSIFGNNSGDGSSNLTYTAPKQPKPPKPTSKAVSGSTAVPSNSTMGTSSVVVVKTVQTFKMIEGAYQNQGRMGAAVITTSSDEGNAYQLLLYRDKRQHHCSIRITRDFNFHIQPKNYCTFYDKQTVIWSILFDNPNEISEFALQVAVAKWKSGDPTTPIMSQDLWCPVADDSKTSTAEAGDSVELFYTIHNIMHYSQGIEENQSVWVEVETSGWKQALVGVQPNTRKVVILQPFMLGDLNPKEVAYSSPVVVKLTVIQVSKSSAQKHQPKEEVKLPQSEPPKLENTVPVDVSTEDNSKSSPKATKADLITRMARMGQALPFKTAAPTPSDSDEPEEDQGSLLRKTDRAVPKPRTRVQQVSAIPPSPLSSMMAAAPPINPPVTITQHPVPIQWAAAPYMGGSMYSVPQIQSPADSQAQFNMFFSEVRTTNSELRMGITRLTDKVEALQNKFEDPGKSHNREVTTMMEKLMDNEQQLKGQLELVLAALNTTQLLSQSRSLAEPHILPSTSSSEPCQHCAEMKKTNTSLSANMRQLKEENEYLMTSSTAQKEALVNAKIADRDQLARIAMLEKRLEEEQVRISNLNERLQDLQKEKANTTEALMVANKCVTELQTTLHEKQISIDKLEQALRDSEATKLDEVRRNLQEVLVPKPDVGEHVKRILNVVFRLVKSQLEPNSKYDTTYVQSILARTIKAVTLEYLQNGDLPPVDSQSRLLSPNLSQGSFTTDPKLSLPSIPQQTDQVKKEELNSLYVRGDTQTVGNEAQSLPVAVPSETTQNVGLKPASAITDPSSVINKKEPNVEVESTTNTTTNKSMPDLEVKNKSQGQSSHQGVDSAEDSSDDVWRPKPPPPPLFDEEENDDDWLIS